MSKKLRLAGVACAAFTAACVIWALVGDADAQLMRFMLATLFAVGGLGMVLLGQCWSRIEGLEARLRGAGSAPAGSESVDDPAPPSTANPAQVAPIALLGVMSMLMTVNVAMLATRPQAIPLPTPPPQIFKPPPMLQPNPPTPVPVPVTPPLTPLPTAPAPKLTGPATSLQQTIVLPESNPPVLTQAVADRIKQGMSRDEVLAILRGAARDTPPAKASLEGVVIGQGTFNIAISQGKRKLVLVFRDSKLADKNPEGLQE
jgi:hypothetical protein